MHGCMTAKFYNVLAQQLNVAHVIMQNAGGLPYETDRDARRLA